MLQSRFFCVKMVWGLHGGYRLLFLCFLSYVARIASLTESSKDLSFRSLLYAAYVNGRVTQLSNIVAVIARSEVLIAVPTVPIATNHVVIVDAPTTVPASTNAKYVSNTGTVGGNVTHNVTSE